MPFKYEFIEPFFEVKDDYIAGIRPADVSNCLYGHINQNIKELFLLSLITLKKNLISRGKLTKQPINGL